MCMEDIRLGRKTTSAVSVRNLANGVDSQIAGGNANRIALTFAPGGVASVVAPTDIGTAAGFQGIQLNGQFAPYTVSLETHGDLVTKPWVGCGLGAASILTVFESFLAEQ